MRNAIRLFLLVGVIGAFGSIGGASGANEIKAWKDEAKMSLAALPGRLNFCKKHRVDEIEIIESAVRVRSKAPSSMREKDEEAALLKLKTADLKMLNLDSYCECKANRLKRYYEGVVAKPESEMTPALMMAGMGISDTASVICAGSGVR